MDLKKILNENNIKEQIDILTKELEIKNQQLKNLIRLHSEIKKENNNIIFVDFVDDFIKDKDPKKKILKDMKVKKKWGSNHQENKIILISKERFLQMEENEKDLYLMCHILGQEEADNIKGYTTFWFPNRKALKELGVGNDRLDLCAETIWNNDGVPCFRVHGNTGKIGNGLSLEEQNTLKKWIESLPHEPWPCELKQGVTKILETSESLHQLWKYYSEYLKSSGEMCAIAFQTFLDYWKKLCPDIITRGAQKDCCNSCSSYRIQLQKGGSSESLAEIRKKWGDHFAKAIERRKFWKVDKSDLTLKVECFLCLSFDFKANIALPCTTWQANLLYFKRKYNINVFGLVKESENSDYNLYLWPEEYSKTSDEICSVLIDFLNYYSFKNLHLVLYCDNCAAQNKNKYMMVFVSFLVNTKRFSSVRVKFLLAGHTHFSPDRLFAWVTVTLKFKDLYEIDDIVKALKNSPYKCSVFSNFKNFRSFLENSYVKSGLKDITKMAEICCSNEDPEYLYVSQDLLPPSLTPDLFKYSDKQKFWKKSKKELNLEKITNLPSSPLSKEKLKDLKTIYESGIILERAKSTYVKDNQ